MSLTDSALEAMLAADGWPFDRLDPATWRSGFASGGEHFRFFLRLTGNWLYLTIIPFVSVPEEADAELPLLRRLLVLNREITLAKLALEGRDVALTVELPTEELSWPLLKDGLDALTYYATAHHAELLELSTRR